ncbi:MAG: PH domain-containing protein [Sphaerobacter sp.]|nr:PH domain-containing protein [Sphaerobacter sp.]
MAYIGGLLGEGEHVLIVARRHPIFLAGWVGLYLIAAAALIGLGAWVGTAVGMWAGAIVGALTFIPLAIALVRFLHWHREQFVVTNYRIIQIQGLFNKRVLDSSLEKVNDILMTQSLMGRLCNYGTLEILTGSEIGVNRLDALSEPFRFKRAILDARTRLGRDGEPPLVEDGASVLVALETLRNAGLLSEDEYQEKRARLRRTDVA